MVVVLEVDTDTGSMEVVLEMGESSPHPNTSRGAGAVVVAVVVVDGDATSPQPLASTWTDKPPGLTFKGVTINVSANRACCFVFFMRDLTWEGAWEATVKISAGGAEGTIKLILFAHAPEVTSVGTTGNGKGVRSTGGSRDRPRDAAVSSVSEVGSRVASPRRSLDVVRDCDCDGLAAGSLWPRPRPRPPPRPRSPRSRGSRPPLFLSSGSFFLVFFRSTVAHSS